MTSSTSSPLSIGLKYPLNHEPHLVAPDQIRAHQLPHDLGHDNQTPYVQGSPWYNSSRVIFDLGSSPTALQPAFLCLWVAGK